MDVDQPTPSPSPKTSYAEKLNLFEHVIGKELGPVFQNSTRLKSEGPALIGRPRAFTLPENHGISEFAQSPRAVNRSKHEGDSISPTGSFTSTLWTGSIKDTPQDYPRSANASSPFTSKSVPIGSSVGVSASHPRNTRLSPSLRRPKFFSNPMDTNESSYTEALVEVDYGTIDLEKIRLPIGTGFNALPWSKTGPTEKGFIILNEYNEDELLVKIRSDMAKLLEDPPLIQSDERFAAHAYGDESEFDKDTWKFLENILKPDGPFMRHIKAQRDIKGSVSTSKEGLMADRNSSSQSPKARGEEPLSDAYQDPTTKSAKSVSAESSKTKATHSDSAHVDGQDRSSKSPESASKTRVIASPDATKVLRRDSLSQLAEGIASLELVLDTQMQDREDYDNTYEKNLDELNDHGPSCEAMCNANGRTRPWMISRA